MMKKLRWLAPALAAMLAAGAALSVSAQEGPPPPSSGEVLIGGLTGTIGAVVGPDGALYITEGGDGGDIDISDPDNPEAPTTFGLVATISRIDPETGAKEVVAEGLPSFGFGDGEGGGGLADVAFIGTRMYFLLTSSPGETGEDDYPNGIYRVNGIDSFSLVVDLGKFNDDNPVDFEDAIPGGNPFGLDVRNGTFFVTDGNYNRLLRATVTGDVDIVVAFDNVVPTGLEAGGTGPLYLTQFSAFPHAPEDSNLVSIALPGGAATNVAGGYAQLIDVETGPGGKLYVLQFGDQQLDENGPPPPGRLLVLDGGTLKPIVTGLFLPTSLDFSGDTAFITSLSGDILKIEGVAALPVIDESAAPTPVATATGGSPAPVATATRPSGISAPDTGSGGAGTSGGGTTLLAIGLIGAAAATCTGAFALRRR